MPLIRNAQQRRDVVRVLSAPAAKPQPVERVEPQPVERVEPQVLKTEGACAHCGGELVKRSHNGYLPRFCSRSCADVNRDLLAGWSTPQILAILPQDGNGVTIDAIVQTLGAPISERSRVQARMGSLERRGLAVRTRAGFGAAQPAEWGRP